MSQAAVSASSGYTRSAEKSVTTWAEPAAVSVGTAPASRTIG